MCIDVLITRPIKQAEAFSLELEKRGLSFFIEPALDVIPTHNKPPSLQEISGIILTSANAIHYNTYEVQKTLPVYTVGKKTAIEAEKAGYKDIRFIAPTAEILQKKLNRTTHKFLYIRGKNVRTDLKKAGLPCHEWVVYEAKKKNSFSAAFLKKLKENHFKMVTFFSARTAEAFITLCKKENLTESFASTRALCLSKAIQISASQLQWESVLSSDRPDAPSLLTLIDKELERGAL